MNKLFLSLVLCLFFAACQNTPKSASDSPQINPPATATPDVVTPEAVQEASAKLVNGVKMMEELRKQVDALPAQVKKEKTAEIEGMYATLEGMIEKQTGMINEIKQSTTPTAASDAQVTDAPAGPSPAQMLEYTESAARYAQEAQAIQEAVQKMATQSKKN
jgi:hypothetical protein